MCVIGVGGEPACGKSTLFRAMLAALGPGEPFAFAKLRGTLHQGGRVAVLGLYGPEAGAYPGTDRLSMAVQPDAVAYVRGTHPAVVLFEGDRLFNASFLRACLDARPSSRFAVLTAPEGVKAQRRAGRGDTKPAAFLSGRATKYKNILAAVPGVVEIPHATPADLDAAAAALTGWVVAALSPAAASP